MVKSYRELQKKLKVDRELGRIPKQSKLNAKKGVLRKLNDKHKAVRNKRLDKMKRKIIESQSNPSDIPTEIHLGRFTNIRDVIKNIRDLKNKDKNVMMEYNGLHYTLNRERQKQLVKDLKSEYGDIYKNQVALSYQNVSDQQFTQLLTGNVVDHVNIYWVPKAKRKVQGAFFPYLHKIDMDLSRYQIYKEVDSANYISNCFVHALEQWNQLEESELTSIKGMCFNSFIPQCKLKKVTETVNIGIKLRRLRKNKDEGKAKDNTILTSFNTDVERVIELGLIEDHYFFHHIYF